MYEYRPAKILLASSVKKFLLLAWICALLIIPLTYFTFTGKAAIDEKKQTIDMLEQSRASCINSLQRKSDNLSNCLIDLQNCNALVASAALPVMNTSCQNQLNEVNKTMSQCEYTFEMLAINSAKQICCVPGMDSASFTVENYKIKCSGNYMINCTTGQLI